MLSPTYHHHDDHDDDHDDDDGDDDDDDEVWGRTVGGDGGVGGLASS